MYVLDTLTCRAVAGVCGAPVQVVPVGPVWNFLILYVRSYLRLFICAIYTMFKFVGVQVQKTKNNVNNKAVQLLEFD